jgi:uncharacterized Zn-finger protein
MTSSASKTAPVVELGAEDLTPGGQVWCPHPKSRMQAWNSHPRVFLSLSGSWTQCPYCSTAYRLATALAEHSA